MSSNETPDQFGRIAPNELQHIFNLRANTPGRLLLPDVYGVMDVSQQWPLVYNLIPQDYVAIAGNNDSILAQPKAGFHQLVIHAYFSMNTIGAAKFSSMFLQNTKNTGGTQNISLVNTALDILTQVPLIGSRYFQAATLAQLSSYLIGLDPVYVPFPYRLLHRFSGAVGAEVCTLRNIQLQLPDSQPFTSLLKLQ